MDWEQETMEEQWQQNLQQVRVGISLQLFQKKKEHQARYKIGVISPKFKCGQETEKGSLQSQTGDSGQETIQGGAKFTIVEVERSRLQAEISTKGKGRASGSVSRGMGKDCRYCESSSKGSTGSVIRKEKSTKRNLVVEYEVQECIQHKKQAKERWDREGNEESNREYKKCCKQVKKAVALARAEAYGGLHENLESMEGEKDVYRIAKQRNTASKGVQQIRVIKDAEGKA